MFVRIRKIIRKILRRPDISVRQFRTPPTLNSNHPLVRPVRPNQATSLPLRPAPPPPPPPPVKQRLVNQPAPREDYDTSSDIIGALLIIEALKNNSDNTLPVERPNPFSGFGGENGGAGANGDWYDTHEDDIVRQSPGIADDSSFSYTSSSNDTDLSCGQDDSSSDTSEE